MSQVFTASRLEALISAIDSMGSVLRDVGMHEEVEILEEAELFLGLLRPMVSPDPEPEVPTPPSQNELRSLCLEMRRLQFEAADLKQKAAEVRIPLDRLRFEKIPECMASLDVKTTTFTGIGRVQLASDLRASTRKGKKPEAMVWLRDLGYDGMIVETYNASSLKALFRRQLEEGIEIPDDIFNVVPLTRASIVKV